MLYLPADFQDMSTYSNPKAIMKKEQKLQRTYMYFIKLRTETKQKKLNVYNLSTEDANCRDGRHTGQ